MTGRDRDAAIATALTVVGAVVVAALFYEGAVLSLSITVRAVLLTLYLIAVVVLAASYPVGSGVGVVAIIAGFLAGIYGGYALGVPGPQGAVIAIGVMAAITIVLYLIQEGQLYMSRRAAHALVAVLIVVTVAFVGVDLQHGPVTYELTVEDSVAAPSDAGVLTVGQVTATNDHVFREAADYPDLTVCLYAGEGRQEVGWLYEGGASFLGRTVPGEGTRTVPLQVVFGPDQADQVTGTLPVERREACPAERDGHGIVVAPGS